jgi:hypothetical protein
MNWHGWQRRKLARAADTANPALLAGGQGMRIGTAPNTRQGHKAEKPDAKFA